VPLPASRTMSMATLLFISIAMRSWIMPLLKVHMLTLLMIYGMSWRILWSFHLFMALVLMPSNHDSPIEILWWHPTRPPVWIRLSMRLPMPMRRESLLGIIPRKPLSWTWREIAPLWLWLWIHLIIIPNSPFPVHWSLWWHHSIPLIVHFKVRVLSLLRLLKSWIISIGWCCLLLCGRVLYLIPSIIVEDHVTLTLDY
jgi:hypothetical protein